MSSSARPLREKDLEELYGISRSSWRTYRVKGGGPDFYKLGNAVFYDAEEVDRWFRSHRRNSTAEYPTHQLAYADRKINPKQVSAIEAKKIARQIQSGHKNTAA